MTDQAQNRGRLTGSGVSFDEALADLLSRAIELIVGPAGRGDPDRSARFQAIAGTQTELISACLNAVMEKIDTFDRRPLGVILDGVRPVANGYRAWGTLFLDPGRPAPERRFRPLSAAVENNSGTSFALSVEVVAD